jgi:hypothetical protein
VAALGRSNTTLGRRSNSSWREAAGREYGSDGYRFGDGTRLAVRKLTETIVKPY